MMIYRLFDKRCAICILHLVVFLTFSVLILYILETSSKSDRRVFSLQPFIIGKNMRKQQIHNLLSTVSHFYILKCLPKLYLCFLLNLYNNLNLSFKYHIDELYLCSKTWIWSYNTNCFIQFCDYPLDWIYGALGSV